MYGTNVLQCYSATAIWVLDVLFIRTDVFAGETMKHLEPCNADSGDSPPRVSFAGLASAIFLGQLPACIIFPSLSFVLKTL